MAELVLSNAFRIVKGHPVTSSREVASHFEKRHNDVLRSIRDLLTAKPALHANFIEAEDQVEIGKGATRTTPIILMDRKGFSLLAIDRKSVV